MEKEIILITLDELFKKNISYDDKHIYELTQEDINLFVKQWSNNAITKSKNKNDLPKILLLSGTTAFDNTCGECFGEDFDTREQAIQYLHGMSYEEIMGFDEVEL